MTIDDIKDALKELHYELTKEDGQYLEAFSTHVWDAENHRLVSINGKRKINIKMDVDCIFFGIREDGDTRFVFNGFIENIEQLKLIDRLTKIF